MERYFGTYQTFQTASRKEAADLIGADNLVGDYYTIECTIENGEQKAWLVNKFQKRVGFFDTSFSRQLSLLKAQEMTLIALLSFVAYTDHPEPGYYWGQAAVMAYDPRFEESFAPFIAQVSQAIKNDRRPILDLNESSIEKVVESKGDWVPKDTVALPSPKKGTALIKARQSLTDRLVEESRKGNKGCYVVSWAFLLALVALIIFGLKSCGVF